MKKKKNWATKNRRATPDLSLGVNIDIPSGLCHTLFTLIEFDKQPQKWILFEILTS